MTCFISELGPIELYFVCNRSRTLTPHFCGEKGNFSSAANTYENSNKRGMNIT
jgi:hypothetical protein